MEWRHSAAASPDTPPAILRSIYEFLDCRIHLSNNPSTPTDILELLSHEESLAHLDSGNRRIAVANVLRHLNSSPSAISRILEWTEGVLNVLREDEDSKFVSTRIKDYFYPSAASNPNTPVKYLEIFAESNEEITLFWLLPNPKLPAKLISIFIAKLLAETNSEKIFTYSLVAQNPSLTAEQIKRLSMYPSRMVKEAIARNPSTSGEILMSLIQDPDSMVRIGCLWNMNLPLKGLQYYANQTKAELRKLGMSWIDTYLEGVRKCVLRNENASDELRNWVVSDEWLRTR